MGNLTFVPDKGEKVKIRWTQSGAVVIENGRWALRIKGSGAKAQDPFAFPTEGIAAGGFVQSLDDMDAQDEAPDGSEIDLEPETDSYAPCDDGAKDEGVAIIPPVTPRSSWINPKFSAQEAAKAIANIYPDLGQRLLHDCPPPYTKNALAAALAVHQGTTVADTVAKGTDGWAADFLEELSQLL